MAIGVIGIEGHNGSNHPNKPSQLVYGSASTGREKVQILSNYAHHLGNCVSIIFLILGSSLAHLEPKLQLFDM